MTKKKSVTVDKKETELIKSISIEQARLIAKDSIKAGIDHNIALKELAEKNLPEYFKTKKQTDEMSNNIEKVSLALSLETGHILAESVPTRYRPFALQLKSDLEKEFDCKTASEIALVDQAVNAHIRKLSYSKLMEGHKEPEWLSHERVAFLNFYSKEVDRSHRQFISAIETLKLMKQPTLRVNIKTNNAFVSENQQFNNIKE
jgi:hypothetical protein